MVRYALFALAFAMASSLSLHMHLLMWVFEVLKCEVTAVAPYTFMLPNGFFLELKEICLPLYLMGIFLLLNSALNGRRSVFSPAVIASLYVLIVANFIRMVGIVYTMTAFNISYEQMHIAGRLFSVFMIGVALLLSNLRSIVTLFQTQKRGNYNLKDFTS